MGFCKISVALRGHDVLGAVVEDDVSVLYFAAFFFNDFAAFEMFAPTTTAAASVTAFAVAFFLT